MNKQTIDNVKMNSKLHKLNELADKKCIVNRTELDWINRRNYGFSEFNSVLNRMAELTTANVDSMAVHHETWISQIKDAMNVNGGDIENATTTDYVMHFCTFGWKVSSPSKLENDLQLTRFLCNHVDLSSLI